MVELRSDPGLWLPASALWRREMTTFLRQKGRIIGAMGTPVVFWLLIGGGFAHSLSLPGAEDGHFLVYFLPGTMLLIVLFSAIFSSISVIEDRSAGFLQGVLVSPAPRASIVLGKVMGGATVAFVQAAAFGLIALFVGEGVTPRALIAAFGVLAVVTFALSSLGFLMAWRTETTQSFHALMNLLLFPMWLLSGALFPVETASTVLQWLMRINPLTYGLAALRSSLYGGGPRPQDLLLVAAFGFFCFWWGTISVCAEGHQRR